MSGGKASATSSAPYAVGGNLGEEFHRMTMAERKAKAREERRSLPDMKSGEVKPLDAGVIIGRFPDHQDNKKFYTTTQQNCYKPMGKTNDDESGLYHISQREKTEALSKLPQRAQIELESVMERRENLASKSHRKGPLGSAMNRILAEEGGMGRGSRSNSPMGSRSNSRNSSPTPAMDRRSPVGSAMSRILADERGRGSQSNSPMGSRSNSRHSSPAPHQGRNSPLP